MRKLLWLLLPLGLWAFSYDLRPVKAAEGIECVIGAIDGPNAQNGGFVSNICWADLGPSVALLDAGPTLRFAQELEALILKRTGKPVSHVILTNYHDDRILAASHFEGRNGVKILGHRSILSDIAANPVKFERLPNLLPPKLYAGTKIPSQIETFEKELIIKGDRLTIKLLKLSEASEAPSDIAVFIPEAKLVFAGNILFNERALNYADDSHMAGWIEAIEAIRALKPAIIVAGHGAITDSNGYKTTLEYLTALKTQVDKHYDDGLELDEVVKATDLGGFSHLRNFDALNGKNIYNYYLQLEKMP